MEQPQIKMRMASKPSAHGPFPRTVAHRASRLEAANRSELARGFYWRNFRFNALPAGEYEMKVVKRGFETYRAAELALESGRDLSQNITLDK